MIHLHSKNTKKCVSVTEAIEAVSLFSQTTYSLLLFFHILKLYPFKLLATPLLVKENVHIS